MKNATTKLPQPTMKNPVKAKVRYRKRTTGPLWEGRGFVVRNREGGNRRGCASEQGSQLGRLKEAAVVLRDMV
jgi:hypothetical protein